jgi:hypothetical protein
VDDPPAAYLVGSSWENEIAMNWRTYALLFILGLVVSLGVASFQSLPGYLDSDYYFVGGLQLVEGKGFTEPFLWNYLDDPGGLPHPSHIYWMPLSSILAAIGMVVTGQHTYAAARLIFILIAACIPPLTAHLALNVTGRRDLSLTSGLLAVFSVYYLPFMPVTDNYGPFMLLGGLIFLLMKTKRWWAYLVMGLLVGLMNLARSDGLLWLGLMGLLVLWLSTMRDEPLKNKIQSFVTFGVLVVLGYFLVMGPWYVRNMMVFGSPMAPGGNRILWLTNYNDTFAFPADQVNMESWLEAGWGAALKVRLWALQMNVMNAFAAQGGILLFPFILIGFWHLRHDIRTRLAGTGWLILLIVMTLIFPLAGARGGFFHAGAAFQTFWWVLAPLGLARLVDVLYRRNILTAEHAGTVFQGMLVLVCVLLSGVILQVRILGTGWQPEEELYIKVEQFLVERGADLDEVAIVRNPAGYYLVSGRPTIVMPPGGPETVLAVAARYNASYFVLEPGGVLEEYQDIYENYESYQGLEYLGEVDGARIYALHPTE